MRPRPSSPLPLRSGRDRACRPGGPRHRPRLPDADSERNAMLDGETTVPRGRPESQPRYSNETSARSRRSPATSSRGPARRFLPSPVLRPASWRSALGSPAATLRLRAPRFWPRFFAASLPISAAGVFLTSETTSVEPPARTCGRLGGPLAGRSDSRQLGELPRHLLAHAARAHRVRTASWLSWCAFATRSSCARCVLGPAYLGTSRCRTPRSGCRVCRSGDTGAMAEPDTAPLLLAVPNFSEGRDHDVLERIERRLAPARFLDLHVDPDHNRSVFTLAGRQGELAPALLARAEAARRERSTSRDARRAAPARGRARRGAGGLPRRGARAAPPAPRRSPPPR